MSNLNSTLRLQSLRAAGTSEGASKAWDTRGRKGGSSDSDKAKSFFRALGSITEDLYEHDKPLAGNAIQNIAKSAQKSGISQTHIDQLKNRQQYHQNVGGEFHNNIANRIGNAVTKYNEAIAAMKQ